MEFSASLGFIHQEYATMHGHTILKPYFIYIVEFLYNNWTIVRLVYIQDNIKKIAGKHTRAK